MTSKERTSIQIYKDTKRRIDRIKAEKQVDYDTLINDLAEAYEQREKKK